MALLDFQLDFLDDSDYQEWAEPEPLVFYTDVDGNRGQGVVLDRRNYPYDLYDQNPETHSWFFIEVNGDMTKYGVTYAHESKVAYLWQSLEVVA